MPLKLLKKALLSMQLFKSRMRLLQLLLLNLIIAQLSFAQTNSQTKSEEQSVSVSIKFLSEILIDRKLEVPAETVSVNTSQLSSEIVGIIKGISVEVGQPFSKGDVLLQLDSTDYDLAYQLVQSNLSSNAARIKQAEIRLQRANDLNDKNYIAADDLLARQTELTLLKSEKSSLLVNSKQAQRSVDKATIKAPYDGIVMERSANVGAYVSPGMPLLSIVQSNNAEVYADVPVHLAESLKKAQNIYFSSSNIQFPVKLINLSSLIQNGTRTQKARFNFINQQAPIGSSGELVLIVSDGLLPSDLVVSRNGQLGIFTIANDKAVFVPLPNAQEGRPVATNLDINTRIIIGGRDRLQDGDSVKVK